MTEPTAPVHQALARIVDHLASDYDTCFDRTLVASTFKDSFDRLASAARVTSGLSLI